MSAAFVAIEHVYVVPGANSLSGVKFITVSPLLHSTVPFTFGLVENASFAEKVSIFLLKVTIIFDLTETSVAFSSGLPDSTVGGVLSTFGGVGALVFSHPVITRPTKKIAMNKNNFFI